MFYCEDCRRKNRWPEGIFKSVGRCEVCDHVDLCFDVHHSHLPTEYTTGERSHYSQKNQAGGIGPLGGES